MNVTAVGIDLAKTVLQVHGIDGPGKMTMRKQLKRREVLGYFANLPPLKRRGRQADGWLMRLAERRNPNVAAVALANKNARIIWALLAHQRDYRAGYASAPLPAVA